MLEREKIYKLAVVSLILLFSNTFTLTSKATDFWYWPPEEVEIFPENLTSADVVVITLTGDWPDSGIPDSSAISISGNNIYFDVIDQSGGGFTAITPWERRRSVGPLEAGIYSVYITLIENPYGAEPYTEVAQFIVSSDSHLDTNYYVDAVDGNDNNKGLSPETSFATIQKAVDTAKSGDSIIMAEGIYTGDGNHDIDFYAKAINIRSTNPNNLNVVASTIIDCQQNGSGFRFQSNELPSASISGLTIVNAANSGIYCQDYSSPTIHKCIIMYNQSFRGGGGIYCNSFSSPIIQNCTISSNTVRGDGGGIYCYANSEPTIANCVISHNLAGEYGGGIDISNGNPTILNCTITNNSAVQRGGGVNLHLIADVSITNSILWDNIASKGSQIAIIDASASVSNSDIQGGQSDVYFTIREDHGCDECTLIWEQGNIDADPCFVNPGYWADINDVNIVAEPNDLDAVWIEGDYHLKSQAGRWDPNSEEWIFDDVTSPCIDAGDPNSPIGYEPYPNGGIINMGAYGGTLEASMSTNDVNGFGLAYNPYPVDGATETGLNVILNWKSYVAISYEIYLGTSENPPFIQKQSEKEFNPGILEPDTQYYWRIDVIDENGDRTVGDIWSFWTGDYLVVDDFERYIDDESDRIFDTWTDGWDDPNNGSFIGYPLEAFEEGHFMEVEIVHSGNRSVPFYYNYYTNDENFSEVSVDTNDLIIGSDWSITNPETLVIWFYGDPDNPAIDQLYFKLNGAEVLYDGDLNNFLLPEWWSWEIDLDDFEQDLGYIDTMTIGIRREAPADREGMVLIDDIRLY